MTKTTAAKAAPAQATPAADVETPAAPEIALRDQIAMRAPHPPSAWINAYMSSSGRDVIDAQALASWAYEYADVMLVERAK